MILNLFYVGSGGFVGSVLRYACAQGVLGITAKTGFPMGTFLVNIVGCFLITFLGGIFEIKGGLSEPLRLFMFIGILGGFTTFSSFGYETLTLFRSSASIIAILNIVFHFTFCLLAAWFGFFISKVCFS